MRASSLLVRLGNWRSTYPRLTVIQKIRAGDDEILLVRAGDTSAPAPTFYVDAKTGRLFREERVTLIDGLGRVGQRTTFSDFRDVSGMLLPYKTKIEIANPLLGSIVTTVREIKAGIKLPSGTFNLKN